MFRNFPGERGASGDIGHKRTKMHNQTNKRTQASTQRQTKLHNYKITQIHRTGGQERHWMISGTNGARQDGDERYGQAGTRHTSRTDSAIKRSLRQVSTLEDTVSTVHCLQK